MVDTKKVESKIKDIFKELDLADQKTRDANTAIGIAHMHTVSALNHVRDLKKMLKR